VAFAAKRRTSSPAHSRQRPTFFGRDPGAPTRRKTDQPGRWTAFPRCRIAGAGESKRRRPVSWRSDRFSDRLVPDGNPDLLRSRLRRRFG
jgi:hypothetical protein